MLPKDRTPHKQERPKQGSQQDESSDAVLRRFALFVDGMARAMILPFGPSLVYRLTFEDAERTASTWSQISYPLSLVVAAFTLGRCLGTAMAVQFPPLPRTVARLGGIAVSLHVFTYGSGLRSVRWLVVIRFFSATLAGLLCGITKTISLPEDETEEGHCKKKHRLVEVTSGTSKIYLGSFALSILSGGLLFRIVTRDSTFQALTGAYQYTLSPLFLIGVAVAAEFILRTIFSTVAGSKQTARRLEPTGHKRYEFLTPDRTDRSVDVDALAQPASAARDRVGSDVFFDCQSVFSDMEDMVSLTEDDHDIALYKDGRCVYANGSPAHVPQGDCTANVPPNYLEFCNGNQAKARKLWEDTQKWRRENHVWKIHTMPNRWFPEIKEAYPHFLHGRSKAGFPVIYEQPGRMNLKHLFRNGCEIEDMVRHYIFFLEYVSNLICTREDVRGPNAAPHNSSSWGIMVVMDVKGAGLSHLSGDVLKYLKRAGDINSAHYPMSMKRAFVINSPFWLAGAWSSVKGILPDSVQVDILSASNYADAIREHIDDDQIPPEYGGSSRYPLGKHPYELELHALVDRAAGHKDQVVPTESLELPPAMDRFQNDDVESAMKDNVIDFPSPLRSTFSDRPLRRRAASADGRRLDLQPLCEEEPIVKKNPSVESGVLAIQSGVFLLWNAVQGAIEVAVPLWVLSPPILGGLGYSPSRSGTVSFCATIVVLSVIRTKIVRVVARFPNTAPMRAFRIGVGAASVLLSLLALVPISITDPLTRSDSIWVITSAIIVLSCLALSCILGRSAAIALHRAASENYVRTPSTSRNWLSSLYGTSHLVSDCETGKLTSTLQIVGEIVGIGVFAPIWSWSVSQERPAPFDGSCCLLLASLISFALYVCSFSLHVNVAGEFAPHPKDGCSETKQCFPFLREVVAVSVSDMASLFEESHWSSTPLLGNNRARIYSDTLWSAVEEAEQR